jgi:carboxypeptidase Taq
VLNTWRRLDDGFIRVEADELSYPLHVILRYRLEQALVAGDLKPADVPGAWNELFEKLLGRTPPDVAHGPLQDIHWAMGMLGYFPNYAMGSMLAAQLFERATADDPDILPALGRGDFGPYFAWVKPRVHARASLTSFDELVSDATGAPLSAAAFKRHVRQRYLEEAAP